MMRSATFGYGLGRSLRREIIARNRKIVSEQSLASVASYGPEGVIVYSGAGNFYSPSFAAISNAPEWRKRLAKPHTGRRHLPKGEKWCELNSCTSSDALLMSIFCHPEVFDDGKLQRLMGVNVDARPEFGVRAAAPLKNGHRDRTEVDMRLGDLLVEAKLTEGDFQRCRSAMAECYTDFEAVFETARLPRIEAGYAGYQLLRNVLSAYSANARFCVIADARRADLREQWFAVMQCVRSHELRLRCQMLTWQEISAAVPSDLQRWLEEKYGIYAPGCEPQVDACEWYW